MAWTHATIKYWRGPAALRRIQLVVVVAVFAVGGTYILSRLTPKPFMLWNVSPSEPLGLYVRTYKSANRGSLIAFKAPFAAHSYIDAHLPYLRQVPILKEVAATEGELICTRNGLLKIGGQVVAPVLSKDTHGALLPTWDGCRPLVRGEFFVFSGLIPNSFDSRYYGPVLRPEIIGVFEPVRAPFSWLVGR